jgi:hypothetical protein
MHYRHVGRHVEDTAEGATLAPGDSTEDLVNFDPENPHNKRLIEDGVLIKIPEHHSGNTAKVKEEEK